MYVDDPGVKAIQLLQAIELSKSRVADEERTLAALTEEYLKFCKEQNWPNGYQYRDGRVTVLGTTVYGSRMRIDEAKLQKRLGPALWRKVTVTETFLSNDKLATALELGLVPRRVVRQCTTETPNKPYVRITRSKKLVRIEE